MVGDRRTECRACGVCCDLYGHTLRADAGDVSRWHAQGRSDLLCRVGPDRELWWSEDGSARLDHCPFFSWRGDGGVCGVHDTKPAECRGYPTPLHGFRCVMAVQFSGRHADDDQR